MSDPAMMETHKQKGEPLSQLSADEILAVQEMRKQRVEMSPELLALIRSVREACEKMHREEQASNKQHAAPDY